MAASTELEAFTALSDLLSDIVGPVFYGFEPSNVTDESITLMPSGPDGTEWHFDVRIYVRKSDVQTALESLMDLAARVDAMLAKESQFGSNGWAYTWSPNTDRWVAQFVVDVGREDF